jgi:hypothetical protein
MGTARFAIALFALSMVCGAASAGPLVNNTQFQQRSIQAAMENDKRNGTDDRGRIVEPDRNRDTHSVDLSSFINIDTGPADEKDAK